MANHSIISLRKAVTPEQVEQAVADINHRRFGGKLRLRSTEELTESWHAARAWIFEAPGARPKNPKTASTKEDLGFCLWLHKKGLCIEVRHVLHNAWIRWVQDVFKHELAKHFGVRSFEGGDGRVATDPAQYKQSLYEFAIRNYTEPLDKETASFVQKFYTDHIPEGW